MTPSFDGFCKAIIAKEPFAFSRWGDGEWSCILGREGQNCDGHYYYPSLGIALAEVLRRRPEYLIGMQPKAMRDMGEDIRDWLNVNTDGLRWVDADIIHNASIEGQMNKFFAAIRTRRVRPGVLVVGPPHIRGITEYIGDDIWFIEVPEQNCWQKYRAIEKQLDEDDDTLVLFCAGMMSKVLIDKLWRANPRVTAIDVGSAFDPYCGVSSRRYHAKIMQLIQEKKGESSWDYRVGEVSSLAEKFRCTE